MELAIIKCQLSTTAMVKQWSSRIFNQPRAIGYNSTPTSNSKKRYNHIISYSSRFRLIAKSSVLWILLCQEVPFRYCQFLLLKWWCFVTRKQAFRPVYRTLYWPKRRSYMFSHFSGFISLFLLLLLLEYHAIRTCVTKQWCLYVQGSRTNIPFYQWTNTTRRKWYVSATIFPWHNTWAKE